MVQINFAGTLNAQTRANILTIEEKAVYEIPHTDWRVFDNMASLLPNAGAADDLGIIHGTHGTGSPSIQTGDLKAAGSTDRKARCIFQLPVEYVDGDDIDIRVHAGMLTTQADNAATIDFAAFLSDKEAGVTGGDLVSTAATSINSTTLADYTFTLTGASLTSGAFIDILMTVNVDDAATGTAVIGFVGSVAVRLDIRG